MNRGNLVEVLIAGLPDDQKEIVSKGANIILEKIFTKFLWDLLNPNSELNIEIEEAIIFNQLSTLTYNGDDLKSDSADPEFVKNAFYATKEAVVASMIEVLGFYGFADDKQTAHIIETRVNRVLGID